MEKTKELSKDSAVVSNHKTSQGYKAIPKDFSIPGKNLHCMWGKGESLWEISTWNETPTWDIQSLLGTPGTAGASSRANEPRPKEDWSHLQEYLDNLQ